MSDTREIAVELLKVVLQNRRGEKLDSEQIIELYGQCSDATKGPGVRTVKAHS